MKKKLSIPDDQTTDGRAALCALVSSWAGVVIDARRLALKKRLSAAVATGEIANPADAIAILDAAAQADIEARATVEAQIREWATGTQPLRFTTTSLDVAEGGSTYTLQ